MLPSTHTKRRAALLLAALVAGAAGCQVIAGGTSYTFADTDPSGEGGGGGGGGEAGCADASTCPGTDDACTVRTCDGGICGIEHSPIGTACNGPNGAKMCDGEGACIACADETYPVCQCMDGATFCNGECVNLVGDGSHCGACEKSCGTNQGCFDSTCVMVCSSGNTSCDEACVDTTSDPANCGSCGTACPVPEGGAATCVDGECGIDCMGKALCGDACVDNMTDTQHCGACDTPCGDDNGTPTCTNGTCSFACDTDFDNCDSDDANGCESHLPTDLTYCGGCLNAPCDGGDVCSGGTCKADCDAPLIKCDPDGCIDKDTNTTHCGACDTGCAEPISGAQSGDATCAVGACGIDCDAGTPDSCTTDDGAVCVDADSDPQACGATCEACGEGERCDTGSCEGDVCAVGAANCGAQGCANLDSDPYRCGTCSNSCMGILDTKRCEAGECVASCSAEKTACGMLVTGISCVDLDTDPDHCGACGNDCASGELCTDGACVGFLYATGAWACGNGNTYDKACPGGQFTLCVPAGTTCPP